MSSLESFPRHPFPTGATPSRSSRPTVLALVAAVALAASATPRVAVAQRWGRGEPRPLVYQGADRQWRVDLPPAMEDALDRYDPDFEPWSESDYARAGMQAYRFSARQTPWAVLGDFNGDGRMDAAVAGRTDRETVTLLLLSSGRRRYRAIPLEREPYDARDGIPPLLPELSFRYPGRYVVVDPRLAFPREVVVARPAVELDGGGREGARLYVVERSGVVPYYLSDRPAPPGAPALPGGAAPGVARGPGLPVRAARRPRR